MLSKEKEKRVAFLKRTDEIQMKIAAHTQSIVEFVKQIGKQTVGNLRAAEKDGLKEMDTFSESIEEKIHQLQLMSKQISAKLEAKPEISIFKQTNSIVIESFKTLPLPNSFTLTDFQPQHINEEFALGKQSILQRDTFRPKVIISCCV